MSKYIIELSNDLKNLIDKAYEQGVTIPEAEKLAAKTLSVRLEISEELMSVDLDSRMRKHGVKAVRAEVYMEELKKHDKKPAEAYLDNVVNLSDAVRNEERDYAESDTHRGLLVNYLDIFKDAHIYFRGIAKGNYE